MLIDGEARAHSIAQARLKFLEGESTAAAVVPERIRNSWQRSMHLGIGIDEVQAPYQPDYDRESRLVRAAGPVLDRLEASLAGSDACLIVTDRRGWVRDRRVGEEKLSAYLDRVHLAPGFSYAEEFVGTNGIGVALEERRPSVVLATEHFSDRLQGVSCAASPIRNPITGRVAGAMNLTCWNGPSNALMAALAQQAAADVERVLYELSTSSERALLEAFRHATHYGDRPVVCLGVGQDLVLANSAAARRLTGEDHRVLYEAAVGIGHAPRARRRVRLTGGRSVRVRCRAVQGAGETAGYLLELGFDEGAAGAADPAGAAGAVGAAGGAGLGGVRTLRGVVPEGGADRPWPVPGLAGADPAWSRAARTASRCAGERVPLLLEGESGVGRAALARAVHELTGSAWAPVVVDAAALPAAGVVAPGGARPQAPDGLEGRTRSSARPVALGTAGSPAAGAVAPGGARPQTPDGLEKRSRSSASTSPRHQVPDGLGGLVQAVRTAPAGPGRALVLRHLEAVPADQADAVARALDAAAQRGTWVVATLGQGARAPEALLRCFTEAVSVPPLRQRLSDLPALAACLLRRTGADVDYAPDVIPLLRRRAWPGNVAELESVLRAAAAGRRTYRIEARDLPPAAHSDGRRQLSGWEAAERDTLVQALRAARGNKLLAAQELGISRTTIYRKMRAYGIEL